MVRTRQRAGVGIGCLVAVLLAPGVRGAEPAKDINRLFSGPGHDDLVVSPVALTQLRLHASARPRVVRQQHNRLTHQPPIEEKSHQL